MWKFEGCDSDPFSCEDGPFFVRTRRGENCDVSFDESATPWTHSENPARSRN